MAEPPELDLSHLSAEERAIIEQVFQRQREETAMETQISQNADKELESIEKQINERKQNAQRLVGTQDDAICQICQKTKFADGIGHKCFYCQLRSCARCGGRVQNKNKPIWACSLCQKRQQILMKTGKWVELSNKPEELGAGMSPSRDQSPLPSTSQPVQGQVQNGPIPPQQQGQQLQQRPTGLPPTGQQPMQQQRGPQQGGLPQQQGIPPQGQQRPGQQQQPANQQQQRPEQRRQNTLQRQPSLETDIHRSQQANGQLPQSRMGQPLPQDNRTRTQSTVDREVERPSTPRIEEKAPMPQKAPAENYDMDRLREEEQRKYSMNQRSGSTTNMNSSNTTRREDTRAPGMSYTESDRRDDDKYRDDRTRYGDERDRRRSNSKNRVDLTIDQQYASSSATNQNAPLAGSAMNTRTAEFRRSRSIRDRDEEQRRGSISVRLAPDPQTLPPAVPSSSGPPFGGPFQPRRKTRLHRQLRSMSSSEEEIMPSTSDGYAQNNGAQPTRSHRQPGDECASEKDLLRYIYGDEMRNGSRKSGASSSHGFRSADMTSPRSHSPVLPGDRLAAKIRNYLSHPVTWQPSADQRRLIGHMVLHRIDSAANGDLGLKVVGGRRSDTGRLGAFITRVRPGSVADTVGRLRPGDEVLEWNGQPLQNATFDQVYEIIASSKNETQVELIVSRSTAVPGGDDFLNVQRILPTPVPQDASEFYALSPALPEPAALSHSQSALLPHLQHLYHSQTSPLHKLSAPYYVSPLAAVASGPPPLMMGHEAHLAKGQIFGRIEISLFYSLQDRQLTVTVHRAVDLPPRPDGIPRNPYVKLFLLPDRSERSRRQSAVLAETLMPVWGESFFYHGLTEPMLMERVLEVTVWDYDKVETNSFLGETLIDFTSVPLDDQPFLYTLVDMDDENPLRTRLRHRRAYMPQRPRSEMGASRYEEPYHQRVIDTAPEYAGYGPGGRPSMYETGMRRSRTYDRAGMVERSSVPTGGIGRVPEEDWNVNHQSGYLSDHGYSQPPPMPQSKHHHRRPRSATAMRPMTAAEMSASRMYSRNVNEQYGEEDYGRGREYSGEGPETMPHHASHRGRRHEGYQQPGGPHGQYPQQHQPHGLPQPPAHQQQMLPQMQSSQQRYGGDPRSPNGRMRMEAMQQQEGGQTAGYGSDGSETMSIHSLPSAPRPIQRRRQPNGEGAGEGSGGGGGGSEDYPEEAGGTPGETNGAKSNMQNMKERKKSLMTRFIPGRNAPNEGKRTGFARSEEVGIPGSMVAPQNDRLQAPFLKQTSKESTDSSHSDNWMPVLPDGPLGTFVDNLGPGQVVGRQVLASPVLGEIQIGIMASRSGIDVEIIRAKNLVVKQGVKINPAPYVKVYLMEGKQCIAKAKTNPVRKTTAPLFQQHLIFNDSPTKKMLQVTVLGDYGRMERKAFMGIAQIRLDDLELGPEPVIGWYKLFHSSSLAGTGPVRKDSENSLVGGQ